MPRKERIIGMVNWQDYNKWMNILLREITHKTYKINTTAKPLLDNHISVCLFIETQHGHNQRNLKVEYKCSLGKTLK